MEYQDFIKQKHHNFQASGFEPDKLNSQLFDFQKDIARWSCRRGRSAIFAGCGLGKTPMQLAWAEQVCRETDQKVLILAPLAVSSQTKREGEKFGIAAKVAKTQDEADGWITITNYERLQHFNPDDFAGIILDESSILKSFTGSIRTEIIDSFRDTPYKLACTATPAPNDFMELGNHSEFVGAMTRTEMLSMFFVHDGGETQSWRLKGHAEKKYWEWLASWAVLLQRPGDLGYADDVFVLPELQIHTNFVQSGITDGYLIPLGVSTLDERRAARKESLRRRVDFVAAKVNRATAPYLVWCDYNDESDLLSRAIADAVEVKGSDTPEQKEAALVGFSEGKIRVMVTKPSIAGFGMNWQHCSNMAFCGLSDSYEQFYQAVRRCWRFGQKLPVTVDIVISEAEATVLENIKRKEADAERMAAELVIHTHKISAAEIKGTHHETTEYKPTTNMEVPQWAA